MKTISFGGTYSSYSASDLGQETGNSNFYQQFLKFDLFRSAKIVSWQIKEQELGKNIKPYTVYVIEVVTSDIEYRIEKRYSSFRNLYKRMSNHHQKSSYFPKLTLFSSGVDQAVVSQRYRALNQFISEICKEQKDQDLITFFDFIEIRATYQKQGLSFPTNDNVKFSIEDELAELITKLSFQYQQAVNILNQIQKKLLQSRTKISGQLIKIAYQGLGKRPGLLEICTHASNEMVCWRVLEIILKLTSFQYNRDAQMYSKGLAICSPKLLKMKNQSLLEYSKVKLNYFKVLDIYFKRNNQINMQDLLQSFFFGNSDTIREFNMWLNTQQKSSIVIQRMGQRSPDRRSETIQKLKSIIVRQDPNWKQLKKIEGSVYKATLERYTLSIYRITITANKTIQQLRDKFVQSSPWNQSIQIQQNGIIKARIKTSPSTSQLFLFQQQISLKGTYQRIRKPPIYLKNSLSFFEIAHLSDNTLCFYYNISSSKKLKNIWNQNTLYYLCQLISQQT